MTMTVKRTILFVFLLIIAGTALAQKDKNEKSSNTGSAASSNSKPTPSNMWEAGAHGGYLFNTGDIATASGYGVGLHLRKSLDYIFSLRGEALYGTFNGTAYDSLRNFENNWLGGTVMGLINLNSLRWNKPVRKVSLCVGAGVGASYYEVTTAIREDPNDRKLTYKTLGRSVAPHASVSMGLAVRLGKRFNVGLDHQATFPLGVRADLIDGFDRDENMERTGFGDILQYSNLRFNFNIGKANDSEPLYWVNPLEIVLEQVKEGQKKQDVSLKDSDGDGVIDAIDQEADTPPDVPVDTKGRTLDSDRDGVADFKDREPYNPPRAGEKVSVDGVIENPNPAVRPGAGGGVTEDRVREIVDEMLKDYKLTESANAVADWFLPMIHFGNDAAAIKYSDYGTLAGIARMMKSNPNLRLVITGHTDATGPEESNNALSYQRSQAVVDHLVENHGIGRGRLIIQWKGQQEALVPSTSSYMNRRVEFRVAAAEDVEMDPPSGASAKKKDGY
ncbi:MAG: OmpA family protein [Saprospiraceae bacterium]|nr:OmpA family protein [Saprospiraceae bacterium]